MGGANDRAVGKGEAGADEAWLLLPGEGGGTAPKLTHGGPGAWYLTVEV